MKVKIKGKEFDFKLNKSEKIMNEIQAPLLQPILRDTSPNALIAEQIKKDFYKEVFDPVFKVGLK